MYSSYLWIAGLELSEYTYMICLIFLLRIWIAFIAKKSPQKF